jgi:hypothetical protein
MHAVVSSWAERKKKERMCRCFGFSFPELPSQNCVRFSRSFYGSFLLVSLFRLRYFSPGCRWDATTEKEDICSCSSSCNSGLISDDHFLQERSLTQHLFLGFPLRYFSQSFSSRTQQPPSSRCLLSETGGHITVHRMGVAIIY